MPISPMTHDQHVTILIVDDDEGHTELIRRSLRRTGIVNPIEAVANGAAALDYVLARDAAAAALLILLDIKMPGSYDGIEVLRRIKADARTKAIPVIMLTTTDDSRDVNRCYQLGCNVYIKKPIEPGAFIEAIRRLGLMLSVMRLPTEREERAS